MEGNGDGEVLGSKDLGDGRETKGRSFFTR
jgi:hypothetical protein